jgi:hypothetical protein
MKRGRNEGIKTESGIRNENREGIKINLKGNKVDPEGYKTIAEDMREVEKSTSSSGRIQV